jgi:hypothetical protein
MLVSIHVDPESASHWYARLYSYEEAAQDRKEWKYAATVGEVCQAVRTWLESVVPDRS